MLIRIYNKEFIQQDQNCHYRQNMNHFTRDSQVTFINHLNCTELFHMNWSQSSAITWFHRLQRLLLVVGEPKWKIASSIFKEGLLSVSAGAEKFSPFVQAG